MKKTYMTSPLFKTPHAFSTRLGGVSQAEFESLNLGFTFGDSLKQVANNWKLFSKETNIDVTNLCCTNQIHKSNVAAVTKEDSFDATNVHNRPPCPIANHDGLVTNDAAVTLAIFTADCGCLLMHDAKANVIGAAHCGWKGTVADIMENTIAKMESLGAHRENITAALGPCIGKCCFEVGPEVIPYFEKLLGKDSTRYYTLSNKKLQKFHIDLRGVIERRLIQLNIKQENISHVDECTVCHSGKYFSYRAENGKTGRLAHIISLPKQN